MNEVINKLALEYRDACLVANKATDAYVDNPGDETEKAEKHAWVKRSVCSNVLARAVLEKLGIECK